MDLTLVLGSACQLRCDYCYATAPLAPMNLDTARKALSLAFAHSPPPVNACARLLFFGGEPLLAWETLQAIDADFDRIADSWPRRQRTLTTNGLALDAERIDWLARRDYLVGLSIDGAAWTHDRYRRQADGRGSHAASITALHRVLDAGLRYQLIMVVNPDTAALLPENVAWLYAAGSRRISLAWNYEAAWDEASLSCLEDAITRLGLQYQAWQRSGDPLWLNHFDSKIARVGKADKPCREACGFGRNEWVVTGDGRIFPCERFAVSPAGVDYVIGHVDHGFDEPRRQALIAAKAAGASACRTCAYRSWCVHWCACANWAASADPAKPGSVQCRLERFLIDLALVMAGVYAS